MKNWMIYGANGYSGRLIAEEAMRRGHRPVLAGRNLAALKELATRLGSFEVRTFALDDAAAVDRGLADISVVLHCAGPFSRTSRPMLDACVRARVHYLDITGEIDVFESVFARDRELQLAGVMAVPGVGFDVVPTDTLAALLKAKLPLATSLALAIKSDGKLSPGTTKTMLEGLHQGGRARRDGVVVKVPLAASSRRIDFGTGRDSFAIQIPWGDVSTAFHSTGIPNIETFSAMPPKAAFPMRALGILTRVPALRLLLMGLAGKYVKGSSPRELVEGSCHVWGEVRDASGRSESLRLRLPEGYRFTAISSVSAVEKLITGGAIRPGAHTPSRAFGTSFGLGLPGVKLV